MVGSGRVQAEPQDETASQSGVFRRRVFYIPGYDPIHPRRYRELYRTESAAQAAISGYTINLKPKRVKGPYGWHVRSEIGGQASVADIEVLVWSDIVRKSMAQGIFATYMQLIHTAWVYIVSGALFRLMRLRKGPIIAALYPIMMLLAQLALAVLVSYGISKALFFLLDFGVRWRWGDQMSLAYFATRLFASQVAGLLAGWQVLRWFKRKDGKLYAYYLMHDYAYSAQSRGGNSSDLEARMTAFRMSIAEAMQGNYDEVLVVGHSSGAHLAVSILADLLREGLPEGAPQLSFLSLGQVVPMVSFLPKADRLRADLHDLAARPEITWVDVTAPGDGCAFALCDPVAVSGVSPPGKIWPLILSAAFTQTLSPERWKELRWKFFRLHFQYLCAFDRPADYDYFQITAGPMNLGARYAGRAASKSVIDRAVNGYTNLAA